MRFLTCLLTLLPVAVFALDIEGVDPAVNSRFTAGYPASPQANTDPRFVGKGLDLSGIGWAQNEPTHAVTLITPDTIMYANHLSVSAGDVIVFAAADNTLKTGRVETTTAVRLPGGDQSDLGVAKLTAPVTGVTPLLVGTVAQPGDLLGHCILLYGHGPESPQLGTNEVVDAVATGQTNPTFTYLKEGRITGMANGESGDSGSPSITAQDGRAVVLGIHLEADQDTFISPLLPGVREIAGPALETSELPPGR